MRIEPQCILDLGCAVSKGHVQRVASSKLRPVGQIKELRAIRRYLAIRTDALPWLFISERRGRLTRFAINYLVSETAARANLAAVHPHTLRHSCGYALADKDVPLRVIQEWLGHRSIEMTVRYTRIAQRRFTGLWRG